MTSETSHTPDSHAISSPSHSRSLSSASYQSLEFLKALYAGPSFFPQAPTLSLEVSFVPMAQLSLVSLWRSFDFCLSSRYVYLNAYPDNTFSVFQKYQNSPYSWTPSLFPKQQTNIETTQWSFWYFPLSCLNAVTWVKRKSRCHLDTFPLYPSDPSLALAPKSLLNYSLFSSLPLPHSSLTCHSLPLAWTTAAAS